MYSNYKYVVQPMCLHWPKQTVQPIMHHQSPVTNHPLLSVDSRTIGHQHWHSHSQALNIERWHWPSALATLVNWFMVDAAPGLGGDAIYFRCCYTYDGPCIPALQPICCLLFSKATAQVLYNWGGAITRQVCYYRWVGNERERKV